MSDEIVVTVIEPDVIQVTVIPQESIIVIVPEPDIIVVEVAPVIGSGGGGGSSGKNGIIPGAGFSGSPKKATVTFDTPYDDTDYAIAICSTDPRSFTYESKTTAGFVINANANTAISGEVSWLTQPF